MPALELELVRMSWFLEEMDYYFEVVDYSQISLEVSYASFLQKIFVADFPSILVVTYA